MNLLTRPEIAIEGRRIGPAHEPLVIAEIGINHEGDVEKALTMVDHAASAGCECVKIQSHIVDDEMVPNQVVPGNTSQSIHQIVSRCSLTLEEEIAIKERAEARGMIFLSTPFSRAAADRLNSLGVAGFKVGSGECNNYPLLEKIATYGKPVILSTGMNDLNSVGKAVHVLRKAGVPFALLHCTSIYPTPYEFVRLGAMVELAQTFPDAVVGLSDHSLSIYPCLGAVALGGSILERHFTSSKSWPGPDIPVSMTPDQLRELIEGSRAIYRAMGGSKTVLPEEQSTIDFAYASVVSIRAIRRGDALTESNIWVKRPGTGEIRAEYFERLLGCQAVVDIEADSQLRWEWIQE